jgi:hypothetical protein
VPFRPTLLNSNRPARRTRSKCLHVTQHVLLSLKRVSEYTTMCIRNNPIHELAVWACPAITNYVQENTALRAFLASTVIVFNDEEYSLNGLRIPYAGGFWKQDCAKQYAARDDYHWVKQFRMDVDSFDALVEELKPHLLSARGPSPNPYEMVACTLRHLAHRLPYSLLGCEFGRSDSTVYRYVRKVTDALVTISPKHVYWPRNFQEFREIEQGFRAVRGLPNIYGATDGTHVRIPEVGSDGTLRALDWVNRKSYYSMNMQGTCDHRMLWTDIYIGWCGSVHDGRVFNNSPLLDLFEKGELYPNEILLYRLPNGAGTISTGPKILADSAYPLGDCMLTPFRNTGRLTPEEKYFNYIHSATRMIVERAFGRLKGRWRILSENCGILEFERVVFTITACAVLHNFVERRNQELGEDVVPIDEDPMHNHTASTHRGRNGFGRHKAMRAGYVEYVNTHCLQYANSSAARQSIRRYNAVGMRDVRPTAGVVG